MYKQKACSLVQRQVDSRGIKRFTGVQKKLKQSQLQPRELNRNSEPALHHHKCLLAAYLRCYTCAYGYKIGELLPRLSEGVHGFRRRCRSYCFPCAEVVADTWNCCKE